jgi:hypothetical protein
MDSELIPSALDMDVSTWTGYILYVSGLPFWFDAITSTIKHAMGKCPEHYLSADKAKKEVTAEARAYWSLSVSLIAQWSLIECRTSPLPAATLACSRLGVCAMLTCVRTSISACAIAAKFANCERW